MDDARLAEIGECLCYEGSTCCDNLPELIAEIRRLKSMLGSGTFTVRRLHNPGRRSYCPLCKTDEADPCEQRRKQELYAIDN